MSQRFFEICTVRFYLESSSTGACSNVCGVLAQSSMACTCRKPTNILFSDDLINLVVSKRSYAGRCAYARVNCVFVRHVE